MSSKRKHVQLSLEKKFDIIKKLKDGFTQKVVALQYGIGETTVRNIRDSEEKLKNFVSSKLTEVGHGEAGLSHSAIHNPTERKSMHKPHDENLDQAVYIWFLQERARGTPISGPLLQAKAINLNKKMHGENSEFKASQGWLNSFKMRHGIHYLSVQGEMLSNDEVGATLFTDALAQLIENLSLTREQLYNCDETGLFWKILPNKTLVAAQESRAPGHKMSKERVTILACANSSGTHKLPLLLIGKAKKPRSFKHIDMSKLPLIYANQHNAWMDSTIFKDWFFHHFVPSVKEHCEKKGLPSKALLLLDNAPSHPPDCDQLKTEDELISIKFLPPNTTALIQPMDQGVLNNIKQQYRKKFLEKLLGEEFDLPTNESLILQLKKISIKDCVYMVASAWQDVKPEAIKRSWDNLLAEDEAIPAFEIDDNQEINNMVEIINILPCNEIINDSDIREWLQIDSDAAEFPILNDEEIIEKVNQSVLTSESDDSEDENLPATTGKDATEAAEAIGLFINWYERQPKSAPDTLTLLYKLKSDAHYEAFTKMRQQSILGYLRKE